MWPPAYLERKNKKLNVNKNINILNTHQDLPFFEKDLTEWDRNHPMKLKLVVARFNEDISWLKEVKLNKIIYNKGANDIKPEQFKKDTEDVEIINLPNVGRDSHTLLKYIELNYQALPDAIIFLQGNPFDHIQRVFNYINHGFRNKSKEALVHFLNMDIDFFEAKKNKFFGLGFYHSDKCYQKGVEAIYKELGIKNLRFTTDNCRDMLPFFPDHGTNHLKNIYSAGCQFYIPKKYILNKPIDFYKKITAWSETENNEFVNLYIRPNSEGHKSPPGEFSTLGYCVERVLLNFFYYDVNEKSAID
jgi:hypothetical protein